MLDYPFNLSGAKHLKAKNKLQTMENKTFENPGNQSSLDSLTECLDNCEFHNHQAPINDSTFVIKEIEKILSTDEEDCSEQQSETDLQLSQVDDPDFDQLSIGYNNSLTEHFIISEKLQQQNQLDYDENGSSFRLSSNELSFLLESFENNCESLSELSSIHEYEMNIQNTINGGHEDPDESMILRKTVEELRTELHVEQKNSSMNVTDLHELHNFKIELDTSKLIEFSALFPKEDTASCYL